MPEIYFMGVVEPTDTHVLMENLSPITERDAATGHITTFTVGIADSVVSVECEIDQYRSDYVNNLYTRALELARTAVNLISLKMGWALTVDLNLFIDPDGNEERLMKRRDSLKDLIDAYKLDDIDTVFDEIASDVNLYMALDDLINGITTPRALAINCARALDGFRNLLAPDLKDKPAWKVLHETLNVDEEYLQPISKASADARHGNHKFLTEPVALEIMSRTFTVANRYLYYRLVYRRPLPLELFYQLVNSPMPQS